MQQHPYNHVSHCSHADLTTHADLSLITLLVIGQYNTFSCFILYDVDLAFVLPHTKEHQWGARALRALWAVDRI